MKKIFISYHHLREQEEKDQLAKLIKKHAYYLNIKDMSIEVGDINTEWSDSAIARTIREKYLKDTNVIIVILGTHTKCRKHIDWEIEASLTKYGSLNRRKKINNLIILLTSDFIQKNNGINNFNSNGTYDYSSLITKENAGQRIYETVINNYAVIDSYDEIFSNIKNLKHLLDEVQFNHKKEELFYQNIISPSFLTESSSQHNNNKDSALDEQLQQATAMNFTKNSFLTNLSSKRNSKDSGLGDKLQQVTIIEDENFKRKYLRKKNNLEDCKSKQMSEKTKFNLKKINNIINLSKINYTQKCSSLSSKSKFDKKNKNEINKLSLEQTTSKKSVLENKI